MKLITEIYDNVEVLQEQTDKGSKWYITGRFMQGGKYGVREHMNANGRIYPENILDESASKYLNEFVTKNRAFGELNHPPTPIVNPERVCIVVKELSKEGLNYNGKAQIVERSPLGQIVIGIMEAGGQLGVSTRALGSLKEEHGIKYVQPDLRFTAVDVVGDPSEQNCWVSPVMEGVANADWTVLEDGTIMQLVRDGIKKKINEDKLLKEFARCMIRIRG